MRGLEFEAQRLQANQRQPPPAGIVDIHKTVARTTDNEIFLYAIFTLFSQLL